jgi:hypothetical protein
MKHILDDSEEVIKVRPGPVEVLTDIRQLELKNEALPDKLLSKQRFEARSMAGV